jgi:hypothetical protein
VAEAMGWSKSLRLVSVHQTPWQGRCETSWKEAGSDWFLIAGPELTRRGVSEIAGGPVPAVQKLGFVRKHHKHITLRDDLPAF